MNATTLFHTITGALLNQPPKCHAVQCMEALLTNQKPTDAQALALLKFCKQSPRVTGEAMFYMANHLADVHDINISVMDI